MRLKVFRLKEGKLEFAGTREPRAGDAILEGSTLMSEVRPGVLELREASTSDFPLLMPTAPPTKAELARAKQAVKADKEKQGRDALANSYKAAHPNATPSEVAAFALGRNPDPEPESLEASIKRIHPDWTDAQIEIFKKGR
jgi:hypothetical protein